MKKDAYFDKMNKLISLPQFQKYEKPRKNAINPILKEEERIHNILKSLLNDNKISKELFEDLKPRGSQPARLYGLAKVHKNNVPMRPVLSMPGSAYHKVAEYVAKCLSVVPECNINASTKHICDSLKTISLEVDEEVVSFDVVSLYTNVPVMEAINVCTERKLCIPGNPRCGCLGYCNSEYGNSKITVQN